MTKGDEDEHLLNEDEQNTSRISLRKLKSFKKKTFQPYQDKQLHNNFLQKRLAKHGSEKDELEIATNWYRAFQQIYIKVKWLNAFASINYVAC